MKPAILECAVLAPWRDANAWPSTELRRSYVPAVNQQARGLQAASIAYLLPALILQFELDDLHALPLHSLAEALASPQTLSSHRFFRCSAHFGAPKGAAWVAYSAVNQEVSEWRNTVSEVFVVLLAGHLPDVIRSSGRGHELVHTKRPPSGVIWLSKTHNA